MMNKLNKILVMGVLAFSIASAAIADEVVDGWLYAAGGRFYTECGGPYSTQECAHDFWEGELIWAYNQAQGPIEWLNNHIEYCGQNPEALDCLQAQVSMNQYFLYALYCEDFMVNGWNG